MRILVLGAAGMLGHVIFRELSRTEPLRVFGTVRSEQNRELLGRGLVDQVKIVTDVEDRATLAELLAEVSPDVVINCIALVKDPGAASDLMRMIATYALFPQQLAQFCRARGARLIHISSDGVFSGQRGAYTEDDLADPSDGYGVAKLLGEVRDPGAVTIRTSIVGHQLQGRGGLLEWFLAQEGSCRCYTRAIFSGLPTVVLARVIRDFVIPRPELTGIYHVAAEPISKFFFLQTVAEIYGKRIELIPDDRIVIDRSLVAAKFLRQAGYQAPDWRSLVQTMHSSR